MSNAATWRIEDTPWAQHSTNFNIKEADRMNIQELHIGISLPDELERLLTMAHNLWWSFNEEAQELYRSLKPDIWESSEHNPFEVLISLSQEDIDRCKNDPVFMSRLNDVWGQYKDYIKTPRWFELEHAQKHPDMLVAYFSMEYGLQSRYRSIRAVLVFSLATIVRRPPILVCPLLLSDCYTVTVIFTSISMPTGGSRSIPPIRNSPNGRSPRHWMQKGSLLLLWWKALPIRSISRSGRCMSDQCA